MLWATREKFMRQLRDSTGRCRGVYGREWWQRSEACLEGGSAVCAAVCKERVARGPAGQLRAQHRAVRQHQPAEKLRVVLTRAGNS
eukprot:1626997-Pleurochrysis_carterae.AAC.1